MRWGRVRVDGVDRIVVENERGVFLAGKGLTPLGLIREWVRWESVLAGLGDDDADQRVEVVGLEWLPPLVPDKLICVGTNFTDHVAEMSAVSGTTPRPQPWPYGLLKPPHTTLVGHGSTVRLPGYAEKVDWEAELAVIIGDPDKARGAEPLDAVFGYSVINDVSVRDFIPPPHGLGLDGLVAKGFDGAAPMGPWVVPASEVSDPQELPIKLWVNGAIKQDSTTGNMIFGVRDLVAHFARIMTLSPGDVIATGTPAGCAFGQRPQVYLAAGDVVDVEVGDFGTLRTIFAEPTHVELLKATVNV